MIIMIGWSRGSSCAALSMSSADMSIAACIALSFTYFRFLVTQDPAPAPLACGRITLYLMKDAPKEHV
ncbi:hypothetical protein NOVOSPHI9U_260120 [Novosphingobium sp. 9U]|nr:hypothetical protein NOVOSPHI9U_260120 [Novosphingobium sp. 9U]